MIQQVRLPSGDEAGLGKLLLHAMICYAALLFRTLFPPTP